MQRCSKETEPLFPLIKNELIYLMNYDKSQTSPSKSI
jgi:hypothetical protein